MAGAAIAKGRRLGNEVAVLQDERLAERATAAADFADLRHQLEHERCSMGLCCGSEVFKVERRI